MKSFARVLKLLILVCFKTFHAEKKFIVVLIDCHYLDFFWDLRRLAKLQNREREVENLALELNGVVQYIDAPSGYNGFGIVGVKVLSSNQQNIPIKNPTNAQYCVVKEKQAEFYQISPKLCDIGDTVYVNTSTQTFLITKPNTNRLERGILLNDDERFWKYVMKHTKL